MGKRIDALKKQQMLTPAEFMASMLFYYVINSKDHFFKSNYNDVPLWLEYTHENDMDTIDVFYLGQDHSFTIIRPSYKQALAIAPQLLDWLASTYANYAPVVPQRPTRGGRGRRIGGPRNNMAPILNQQGNNQQQRKRTQIATNQRIARKSQQNRPRNKGK